MNELLVFDPAMCCSSDVRGPEAGPELVRLSAPVLVHRAAAEVPLIERVRGELAAPSVVVPLLAEPPAGPGRLHGVLRGAAHRPEDSHV